jgi:glutamate transport system substrate-binding protein
MGDEGVGKDAAELRQALHRYAEGFEPVQGQWARIEGRHAAVTAGPRPRRSLVSLAVMAVVVASLLLAATVMVRPEQVVTRDAMAFVEPGAGPQYAGVVPVERFPPGSTMAAIQARGVIRVGIKFDQPYFGNADPATHEVAGFDAEIAKLIAVRIFGGTVGDLGPRVEWVEAVSGKRESLLEEGVVDIVVATYSITDERRARVDFAGPYYQSTQDIMVRADDRSIVGVDDLIGKRVCTAQGSTSYQNLVARQPGALTILRDTYSECADALRTGVVDAVSTDRAILSGYNLQSGGAFKLLNASFGREERYGIGLRRGDPEFRTFLNRRLRDVVANGDWSRAARYSLSNLEPSPPEIDNP